MEHDSDTQEGERKRDKKGGGLFPWLSRSGSPTIPTGIDWSSPVSALRSFWTMLAYAPQGTLLRFALGAAVAVHGLILGASIMSKNQSDDARGEVEFLSRVQARDAAASALGGRTPMDALITGGKVLLGGGPSTADASAGGEGADEEGVDEEGVDGGDAAGAEGAEAVGAASDDASASADPEGALKAAMEAANAGGGAGKPRLGALSTQFGGSGSSAKLDAWSGNGGSKGAGGGAGGKSARGKSQVRTNSGRMAKNPVRNHGALKQLGFANAQSRRGLGSGSKQAAYEAASNAFEGQTGGGGGGAPIGGTGAGVGGSDTGATPSSLKGGSVNDKNISGNEYCTTGRYFVDGECKLIKTSNQTPWQDAVGRAMGSLIGAGIAFFTAILLWKVVLPSVLVSNPAAAPFVKAAALTAAFIGAALLMHAFVVANQIETKYGQKLQKDSIIDQGLRNSAQGKMLDTGPSRLEDVRKLRNRSGSDRDFGFNQ